ncbi:MAG: carboxymuconolactone decarboxylase family protein [Rhizobiaceae bacterium]|jgi:AhpD family alkylhydroperoxidase|nr:carboxymuconolactone decarboxylase family protein [Hyphomicrobiales bacterium]
MTPRLNAFDGYLGQIKPLIEFGTIVQERIDPTLRELVKIRASQINGCAICLHMHANTARANGETEERLLMLDAWRNSPLYSERERAALGWTEALTRVAETHAPDDAYDALRTQFSEEEQVDLTLLIGAINSFNRLGVGFRVNHPDQAQRKAA